jgi:hypothetical protein
LVLVHIAKSPPQALTQIAPAEHAPEQHAALLVHGDPIAMHAPPASGGGAAQHPWLVRPQLSTQSPLHPLGTQHAVPAHSCPPGHEPQATVSPQLLTIETWQRPLHAAALSGVQQVPASGSHSAPAEQLGDPLTPQFTARLQLFVACPHWRPAQVVASVSGMQPHVLLKQETPASHTPQSTGRPQLSVV